MERSAFDRRGFLARSAAGAAAIAGAGALGGVPALDLASALRGGARQGRHPERRHRPGLRGHQRDHGLRLSLGPADGLRDVRHAREVRQHRQGGAPARRRTGRSPTRKTTIVTIRKGVKFHSGKDLTVDDVVWSLNRIHDTTQPVSNNFLALPADIWGGATKVDDSTLKIVTKKPTRMVENWRFWFIMPANSDNTSLGVHAERHGAVPVLELRQGRPARAEGASRTTGTRAGRTSTT